MSVCAHCGVSCLFHNKRGSCAPCKDGCTKAGDGRVTVTIDSPIPKMPDGHVVLVQGEEIEDVIVEAEALLDDESVAQCSDPMDFVNLSRRLLGVLKTQNNR